MSDYEGGDLWSDIFRAPERVLRYLEEPTTENRRAALEAARAVRHWGYLTAEALNRLVNGDVSEWGKLLYEATDHCSTEVHDQLKARSPLAGKALMSVKYGVGFVTITDPEGVIEKLIRDAGHGTRDCQHYLLGIPDPGALELFVIEDTKKTASTV